MGFLRAFLVFLFFASSLVFVVFSATPAYAYNPCHTYHNFFAGTYDSQYTTDSVEGAWATILVHGNTLCNAPPKYNDQSGWAMIADPSANNHYAQSGFLRNDQLGYKAFAESTQGGLKPDFILDTTAIGAGGSYIFWEQYYFPCRCIRENIGNHVIAQTAFDPYTSWTLPFQPQFFNEVQFFEDNQAGTPTYPVVYTGQQYQRYAFDTWEPAGCTLLPKDDDNYHWIIVKVSCSDYHVYTYNPRS